jgi:hypothetical protein
MSICLSVSLVGAPIGKEESEETPSAKLAFAQDVARVQLSVIASNVGDQTAVSSVKVATEQSVKPAVPTSLRVARKSSTSLKVSWKIPKAAKGVVLYQYLPKSKRYHKVYTTTKATSKGVRHLKANRSHSFKLRSYRTVGKKTYYSVYTYVVSAYTYTSKSKIRNATAISSPNAITFGLRMSKTFKVSYKRLSLSKYTLAGPTKLTSSNPKVFKVLSYAHGKTLKSTKSVTSLKKAYATNGVTPTIKILKKAKKGKASTYRLTFPNKIKATGFGNTIMTLRAHNGNTKKVKVTVKNYARVSYFQASSCPLGIQQLTAFKGKEYPGFTDTETKLEPQGKEVCQVAEYFYTHPNCGTGLIHIKYDDNYNPVLDDKGKYILVADKTLHIPDSIKTLMISLFEKHFERLSIKVTSDGVIFTTYYGWATGMNWQLYFLWSQNNDDSGWLDKNQFWYLSPCWYFYNRPS